MNSAVCPERDVSPIGQLPECYRIRGIARSTLYGRLRGKKSGETWVIRLYSSKGSKVSLIHQA